MIPDQQSLVIWVLDDGKPGHRNQSLGLAEAMGRIRDVSIHLMSLPHNVGIFSRIKKACEEAGKLPKPDFVIAAGHKTHLALLYLARKTGARSVVLMKPSMPCRWFDHCLIPEHDFQEGVKTPRNVVLTKGALNRVTYDPGAKDGSGLILIGGKSSEFGFDGESLRKAIDDIVGTSENVKWSLTDSRRTPAGFLESLRDIPISTHAHETTDSDWLPNQLRRASVVWATEDSVSMIYEALSSGAQVGLLPMPRIKNAGRVAKGVEALVEEDRLEAYSSWRQSRELPRGQGILSEAERCAAMLASKLFVRSTSLGTKKRKVILWWGRFDPAYSRSSILRHLLNVDGWDIQDFHPRFSSIGDLEAYAQRLPCPALVWVPCFRQGDFAAARRFASRQGIPLIFDPLISAYDKRIFEKRKYAPTDLRARRLRRWESQLYQSADVVLADTDAHKEFYVSELGADLSKVFVVPVGAEEGLFVPQKWGMERKRIEVLFYGSFVQLQGADVIVEAAKRVPEVDWVLLGQGKLRQSCMDLAKGCPQIRFENPVPYDDLAARIGQADILLGVFGDTPKAMRVIPNKFYQSIACARPVITLDSEVYIEEVRLANQGGIQLVKAADPEALAQAVREAALQSHDELRRRGQNAREIYERFYATEQVHEALKKALVHLDI